MLNPLLSY